MIAFLLDNTIKCENPSDRGLHKWIQVETDKSENPEKEKAVREVYNLPGALGRISGRRLTMILPIFPYRKADAHQSSRSTASTQSV